jgi:tRNA dimethylallyltransferase
VLFRSIDIVEPTESYSAGRFRADATALIADIHARGRIPLLVGGTMLYFRALKHGLDDLPAADPALRAKLDARAAQEGWPALHAELARLDPATAARLAPNDAQRIQRALEVCLTSGQALSALHGQASVEPPWRMLEIALIPADRAWLHARIDLRFKIMLEAGLVEELRALRARYALTPDMASMRCVGYRQAWNYLDGDIDLATLRDQGTAATRQLAKRQLTWLRSWRGARVLDPMQDDAVLRVSDWLHAESVSGG